MSIDLQTGFTTGIACIQPPGRSTIQVAAKNTGTGPMTD